VGENGDGEKITERFGRSGFQIVNWPMFKIRFILFCLLLATAFVARAVNTNSLVWQTASDRVSADIHGEALWPLLEDIAHQTGWHIFVEPDTERSASTKFRGLPSGDALKMLLGNLNFALVPRTNAPSQLYVFRTTMQNATKPVVVAKPPRRVANELLIRVKPGTDIDALAKRLGAKITGRMDKLGIYRLQFADAAATDAALAQLKTDSDVLDVDYNYYFDPPPTAQMISPNASGLPGPVSLPLDPPTSDCSKVIVGLVDTSVQPLGDLEKFMLKRLSVADGGSSGGENSAKSFSISKLSIATEAESATANLNHGTGMAQTILAAVAKAQVNGSSVRIVAADVYGSGETTTTWNVALGVQAVIDNGATFVNLSLGGSGQSAVLANLIQSAEKDGIGFFAAAGNEPVTTPTYPAAYPGVNAVTALQNGQLAPYANYGSFVDMALPGSSVVYLGNQAYLMQGTSVSTAYATGVAAGNEASSCAGLSQIQAAMQQKFVVPQK
jgi:thermitase